MSNIILTISLLVSGREDTTEKCLNSLRPLMEQVKSELILVDTGCGEVLKETLKTYTDQVVPFAWCDDFAKARNAGLARAQGEWFLFLDDDEWFEDVSPIVQFFASGEYREYEQAAYLVRNYRDMQGRTYSDDWVSRMIHIEEDTHFEGRVHESLVPARGKCKRLPAFAHHYGYVFQTEEDRKKHFARNANILEDLMAEEPQNMRWPLQMMQECLSMQDGVRLYEAAMAGIRIVELDDKHFTNLCRGAFYTGAVAGLGLQQEYDVLNEKAAEFLQDTRNANAGKCGVAYQAAQYLRETGQWERVSDYCTVYYDAYVKMKQEVYDEQEQIIQESIVLVTDTVTPEAYDAMVLLWAKALCALERIDEFPDTLTEDAKAILKRHVDGNGEFLLLPEELWQLGAAGLLPLEETLLSLPLSQWMAQVMVLRAKKDPAAWETAREHLQSISTKDDIRYHYFTMYDVHAILERGGADMNFEELLTQFYYFAESSAAYAGEVYTPQALEGGMEMLIPECCAGLWAAKSLQCDPGEWKKMFEMLRKAAAADPSIGTFIKNLAKAFGKEGSDAAV